MGVTEPSQALIFFLLYPMMAKSLMIPVERRAGFGRAATVCAVLLSVPVYAMGEQDSSRLKSMSGPTSTLDAHKKKAPDHEPTSAELFDYIHGAMLSYS